MERNFNLVIRDCSQYVVLSKTMTFENELYNLDITLEIAKRVFFFSSQKRFHLEFKFFVLCQEFYAAQEIPQEFLV